MSPFILTILTGVELLALLLALAIALEFIRHLLESIAGSLDKIAMGVRAIEVETGALPGQLNQLNGGLAALSDALKEAVIRFALADGKLKQVLRVLRRSDA